MSPLESRAASTRLVSDCSRRGQTDGQSYKGGWVRLAAWLLLAAAKPLTFGGNERNWVGRRLQNKVLPNRGMREKKKTANKICELCASFLSVYLPPLPLLYRCPSLRSLLLPQPLTECAKLSSSMSHAISSSNLLIPWRSAASAARVAPLATVK